MKQNSALSKLLVSVIISQMFCSCSYQIGCKQFDNSGNDATCCRYYREAVWDYIEIGKTKKEQCDRTIALARLLKNIKKCNSCSCIKAEIAVDTIAHGFKVMFLSADIRAEKKRCIKNIELRKVIITALENGVRDYVDSLKAEVSLDY